MLEPFRSGFVNQTAAVHGDFVTSVIVGTAEWDYERHLQASLELFGMVADDQRFGAQNREVMNGWLAKYVPPCVEAGKRLQPIWSQPRIKQASFPDAWEGAQVRINSIVKSLHLELPQGVALRALHSPVPSLPWRGVSPTSAGSLSATPWRARRSPRSWPASQGSRSRTTRR